MGETIGVLAAMLSSAMGGLAVGATRYLAGAVDPLAIGAFRFGIGFLLLCPLLLLQPASRRWPRPADRPKTIALGLLFFALFPILFNASLRYTTAARGALALSTLPLLTMAVAALLREEALTARKSIGVLIAMAGVALALLTKLDSIPPEAWRGDLLMVGAALCMAFYSVWSRPLIRRCGALPFTTLAMAAGAGCLLLLAAWRGSFASASQFGLPQWLAVGYLGLFGGAIGFLLWAFALARTTPTLVAVSVTVNPVAAAWLGARLLGEPIAWNLVLGLAAVLAGIAIASGSRRPAATVTSS